MSQVEKTIGGTGVARRSGLNKGWHLFKPKADAEARRAVLQTAVDRLNGSAGLPPGLSPFSVAPCRADINPARSNGQIRATLSADPGALELRCSLRIDPKPQACSSRTDRDRDAEQDERQAIKDAHVFAQAELARLAADTRDIVTEALAQTAGLATPIRLIAIGVDLSVPVGGAYVSVDLATIGQDLMIGVDRSSGTVGERLRSELDDTVAKHIRLEQVQRKAAAAGISGWIDGAAIRILALSGLGLIRLLELLTRSSSVEMSASIGGRVRQRVQLRWLDGVVSGVVGCPRDEVHYARGVFSIRQPNVPDTLLAALPGRPLGNLVAHPLIPSDPVIRSLSEHRDRLVVEVEEAVTAITPAMSQAQAQPPRTASDGADVARTRGRHR